MKKILGLDLGTNSIGWAVVSTDDNGKPHKIEGMGSRIIPMDASELNKFNSGNTISKTAERTRLRSARKLIERGLLRRERLHRVLNILNFLPEHYAKQIGWNRNEQKYFGKFLAGCEPKLAWSADYNDDGDPRYKFIFMDSFNEMMTDFENNQRTFVANGRKVPHDWTIYFLRKKALSEKISKEELAWIILNFNQKRGYYQLRGEDDAENTSLPKTRKYFDKQVIKSITDTGKVYKGLKVILVELADGNIGKIFKKEVPLWQGIEKNIIATVDIDANGKDKIDDDGLLSQRFLIPTEKEWETEWKLIKLKTENDLKASGKTVGEYIYDAILLNPHQKIRGQLVRTIERHFYKQELEKILNKQSEFHPELRDKAMFDKCITDLYYKNEKYRESISSFSIVDLIINDIIFYQRPLKIKKSLISKCPFETLQSINGETYGIRCIPKSHPLFQEFRLWKFISNLRIYDRDYDTVPVTEKFLTSENDYVQLFEYLNNRKEIDQNTLFSSFFKLKKNKNKETPFQYRWNYVQDKAYPCNETRSSIVLKLEKAKISSEFLSQEIEEHLWHILYSVEDKFEVEKALFTFAEKHKLPTDFIEVFKKFPPFKKEYGSFSAKAIKKLLALMRMGKYWNQEAIDKNTLGRIERIINAEFDETINNRVREKLINFKKITDFQAIPEWLACYVVYNRFSEVKEVVKWETPQQLNSYIKSFKQHSLRNPIVEQIILETLRTVSDIWVKEEYIDEIHVELGREMKNDKNERKRLADIVSYNEVTNLRIKAMLIEFKNTEHYIDGVRPYSPMQQEILKIYEEYALSNLQKEDKDFEFISKIAKNAQPNKSEITRYRLWLEQKYQSPYTGEPIPLNKLFTEAYQIEHIIPQSRFFDDSLSNKVICEAEVNALKDRQLGLEFIQNHHGEKVHISSRNRSVEIFSVEVYEKFVKENYANNRSKLKKLLLNDIPDQFIERQLNDTRYISKEIKRLLSNIVREKLDNGEYEQEATSKNVIPITGAITSQLKQDWGLNDKWNEIILPRFKRLNHLTNSTRFTAINSQGHEIPDVPFELKKGFSTKRIDHRHHALDAVVIACATRDHVQYLNNENAKSQKYHLQRALAKKLRRFEDVIVYKKEKNSDGCWVDSKNPQKLEVPKEFFKPWESFPVDVKNALENVIVSFKTNLRIINKTTNRYQRILENGKKDRVSQGKGDSWAIRKPLHKDTVHGEINLRQIKTVYLNEVLKKPTSIVEIELKRKIVELLKLGLDLKQIKKYFDDNKDSWSEVNLSKIKVYYFTKETSDRYFATRKNIDSSFDRNKILNSITDTGIQKILLKHLILNENNPEIAFSPDGIEEMNRNIVNLNDGKSHQPIYKVRIYEKADKFAVGQIGSKKTKFVEAAKGTNLFFAVYESVKFDEENNIYNKIRSFSTIPLNEAIERLKEGKPVAPEIHTNGATLQFVLSPYDLVFVPSQIKNGYSLTEISAGSIYKFVSCTGNEGHFVPVEVATSILNTTELGSNNKSQRSWNEKMIKEICIPLKVDRLGRIVALNGSAINPNE